MPSTGSFISILPSATVRWCPEAAVKAAGVFLLVLALGVPVDCPSRATVPSVQTA